MKINAGANKDISVLIKVKTKNTINIITHFWNLYFFNKIKEIKNINPIPIKYSSKEYGLISGKVNITNNNDENNKIRIR